jgi:hypothetical protein
MRELDLKKYLDKYKNTTVDFYRFPGNYGDSLIWHGTMILLNKLRIKINYVEIDSQITNDVLIIDGGGNFVDYYNDVSGFLSAQNSAKNLEVKSSPHSSSDPFCFVQARQHLMKCSSHRNNI